MKIGNFQDTRKTKFSGVQEIQRISKYAKNQRFLCTKRKKEKVAYLDLVMSQMAFNATTAAPGATKTLTAVKKTGTNAPTAGIVSSINLREVVLSIKASAAIKNVLTSFSTTFSNPTTIPNTPRTNIAKPPKPLGDIIAATTAMTKPA